MASQLQLTTSPLRNEGLSVSQSEEIGIGRTSRKRIASAMSINSKQLGKRARKSRATVKEISGADRLLFRIRGFAGIYNPALPLQELEKYFDRHQFSTTVSGLNYDSHVIRNTSMRAIWNLSQNDLDCFGPVLLAFGRE